MLTASAGNLIHSPTGHQIWGPLGQEDVCPNSYQICVQKFEQLEGKGNPAKAPKLQFVNGWGPIITVYWGKYDHEVHEDYRMHKLLSCAMMSITKNNFKNSKKFTYLGLKSKYFGLKR